MGENIRSNMNEREIKLGDFVIEILLRWRMVVVLMVIGGVLFAGLSYLNSYRAAEAQKSKLQQMEAELAEKEDVEADKQWLEEQLTETQIANVNNALTYEQMYEERQAFQKNSLIMNIDPFNVSRVDITFFIQSDDMDRTYNIQKIYEDVVNSTGLYDYIKQTCDVVYNPSEMILLERTSYGQENGTDTVRICVIYNEEKMCQEVANRVVEYVKTQQIQLSELLGEHEISVLDQTYSMVINETYLTSQKNCDIEIMNYRNNFTSLKSKFTDDEWRYYNYLKTGKATENADADKNGVNAEAVGKENILSAETISTPSISIKYIILGMILFAFVYVFYAFMKYILDNKLRSTENLADIYNLSQLGFIPAITNKKKFLGFIDAWILALRDRSKRRFTADEAINMAAVAVKMAIKKSSNSEVYLVGCDIKNQTTDVCQKMQSILSKDNIEAKILDNVLYNAESMAGLEDAHCVVLVEKAGSTLYAEIAKELEILARQDIIVLGGIMVE